MKVVKIFILLSLCWLAFYRLDAKHGPCHTFACNHHQPCHHGTVVLNQQLTGTDCLPINKLFLANSLSLGAPAQAVALHCDDRCYGPLVAVGGYKSECNDASLHLYTLDTSTNNLIPLPIDNPIPSTCIYSLSWCCINDIPYLAVGGAPDPVTGLSVWIYRFDPLSNDLTFIAGYNHGNIIYSVSWLCNDCHNSARRFLAVGGKQSEGINIRLLTFDANNFDLNLVSSRSFGATVFTLDWCLANPQCPQLVAGGKTAHDCQHKHNLRIYSVSCGGKITPIVSTYYPGGTVRVARWCCDPDRPCSNFPWIAVGGDPIGHCKHSGSTIALYLFDQHTYCLKAIAFQQQQSKVFALEWLASCNCTHLAVGSGCFDHGCWVPNIVIYELKHDKHIEFCIKIQHQFNDNITSLSSCKIGEVTYLLAGAESNKFRESLDNPWCFDCPTKDLAIFTGKFCTDQDQPKAVCCRSSHFLYDEQTWCDSLIKVSQESPL